MANYVSGFYTEGRRALNFDHSIYIIKLGSVSPRQAAPVTGELSTEQESSLGLRDGTKNTHTSIPCVKSTERGSVPSPAVPTKLSL